VKQRLYGHVYIDSRLDTFKMGVGDRLFRNLKFLLLGFNVGTHTKYRLWCWRMLAYDLALLSEAERYVYRNNISVNMVGGTRKCIANDNLVEIHVKKVKHCMRAMGPNVTFSATRTAAKCIGTVSNFLVDDVKSGKHSSAKTTEDIRATVSLLVNERILMHTPGRIHATFPNIASDLTQNVDLVYVDQWLTKQKKRASVEM